VLDGIRVVDMSWAAAGPYCAMLLGDLGADVVKVEHPAGGDRARFSGVSRMGEYATYHLALNRNKRSVVLDLATGGGKDAFTRLVAGADVLIENFRPGVIARLGFGDETLRRVNDRLVVCSISGFGQDGPYRDRKALDLVGQALGGLMSLNGPDGGPMLPAGVPLSDLTTGLNACIAILAALLGRERKGHLDAPVIDVSLLSSTVSLLSLEAAAYLNAGTVPQPHGGGFFEGFPYEAFETLDGFVAVGASDREFADLCRAAGLDDLAADPALQHQATRIPRRQEVRARLREAFRVRATDDWIERLVAAGVYCSPANRLDEVFADPQVRARALEVRTTHPVMGEIRLADSAFAFAAGHDGHGAWPKPCDPPPLLGEHTIEVLRELGYSEEDVDRLCAEEAAFYLPSSDTVQRVIARGRRS
jgi:crotonobetainyl-CoA:carnitine CoA-transferase CaiB-like acyl-CoA transferase